jgi:hypothetical protein
MNFLNSIIMTIKGRLLSGIVMMVASIIMSKNTEKKKVR